MAADEDPQSLKGMTSCRWEVKFRVKPSLNESATIYYQGYTYKFELCDINCKNEMYVIVNDNSDWIYEKLPDSEDGYEYETEGETLANKHAKLIKDIILERMVHTRFFDPIKVEIVGSQLLNREELHNAGLLREKKVKCELTVKYKKYGVEDSLSESHKFWQSGFKNKSKKHEDDALRIADWLQRSKAETDEIKSFILAWIAFNGLYGLVASINGKGIDYSDADKIRDIMKELLKNNDDVDSDAIDLVNNKGNLLDKLESYGVLSKRGKKDWSEELKKERIKINIDYIEILKYAALCIYGVRGEVFHEAKQPEDIIDRVKICNMILNPMVAICLNKFVKY